MPCASQPPTALLLVSYYKWCHVTHPWTLNPAAAKYYTACSWFSKAFGDAGVISDANSHGDFNRILYRYEKKTIKHCLILQFLLENGKNASFHIQSHVKNFHGRAKGGIAPCPPP